MHLSIFGSTLCAQVTAAALAAVGHNISLYMEDAKQLAALKKGASLWKEPGLDAALSQELASGRLRAHAWQEFSAANLASSTAATSTAATSTAATSTAATSTADRSANKAANLEQIIFLALAPNQLPKAHQLIDELNLAPAAQVLLINQSTFPVGSCENLATQLQTVAGSKSESTSKSESISENNYISENSSKTCAPKRLVVSLPDQLQEGSALLNFTRPTSIILGCTDAWAEAQVREILRPFNRRSDNLLVMSPREAEFTKLAITGMLATRLSFMNDLANLADALSVDIEKVRLGVGADARIGEHYLYPGCGFGGLSFSRDVISLAKSLAASGVGSDLLEEVLAINERQKELLFRKLWQHFATDLQGRTLAIWGAAFKPGSERIDNAPSLSLLEALWAQGARVQIHDPQALPALESWAQQEHPEVLQNNQLQLCSEAYSALHQADALLVVTEWKTYWAPDFARIQQELKQPVILDGRNIYDPTYLRSLGFTYFGVGR